MDQVDIRLTHHHGWRNPLKVFFQELILLHFAEVFAVTLLLLYLIAFSWGMRKKRLKRGILDRCVIPVLKTQFYSVQETPGEGISEVAIYATGRKNCRSALAKIILTNAHDFLSLVFFDRLYQIEDRMLIVFEFFETETFCPIVFALVHSKILKAFLSEFQDVKIWAKAMPREDLPKNFVYLIENRESKLLNSKEIILRLKEAEHLFRYLLISDQIGFQDSDPPKREVQLCTILPENDKDCICIMNLIEAICALVDKVVQESDMIYPSWQDQDNARTARSRVRQILFRGGNELDLLNTNNRINTTSVNVMNKKLE